MGGGVVALLIHDLGKGYELRPYNDPDTNELVGYTITGPAGPNCKSPHSGRCGGLCAIKPYTIPVGQKATKTYHIWTVTGEWPNLTFSPSVMCGCGDQHSFIVNGEWQ